MREINHENAEEWMLLAIDKELTGQELALMESWLQAHAGRRPEYEALKAAVLVPGRDDAEVFTFPDRGVLYHTEPVAAPLQLRRRKNVRLLSGIAASLAIVAALNIGQLTSKENTTAPQTAATTVNKLPTTPAQQPGQQQQLKQEVNAGNAHLKNSNTSNVATTTPQPERRKPQHTRPAASATLPETETETWSQLPSQNSMALIGTNPHSSRELNEVPQPVPLPLVEIEKEKTNLTLAGNADWQLAKAVLSEKLDNLKTITSKLANASVKVSPGGETYLIIQF